MKQSNDDLLGYLMTEQEEGHIGKYAYDFLTSAMQELVGSEWYGKMDGLRRKNLYDQYIGLLLLLQEINDHFKKS